MELIQPPIGRTFVKTSDWGDTKDIIAAILEADETAPLYTADFAHSIPANNINDVCSYLYEYVRDNVNYNEDPDGRQDVQMPGVLVDRKSGDCKSMSLFCASVLSNLGIPYKYRFISQDPKSDLHHVYLIVKDERGREIALDCVEDRYNKEVKYVKKRDMRSKAKIGKIVLPKTIDRNAFTMPDQSATDSSLLEPQTIHKPQPVIHNTPISPTAAVSTKTWLLIGAAVLGIYFITRD